MAVSDWSTVAANNTTIGGINIAEGCPAANVNNVIREMAAEIKSWSLTITGGSYMPLTGGTFTGNIVRQGAGGYLYNAGPTQSGGAVYVQPSSNALPSSPTEGTIVLQY